MNPSQEIKDFSSAKSVVNYLQSKGELSTSIGCCFGRSVMIDGHSVDLDLLIDKCITCAKPQQATSEETIALIKFKQVIVELKGKTDQQISDTTKNNFLQKIWLAICNALSWIIHLFKDDRYTVLSKLELRYIIPLPIEGQDEISNTEAVLGVPSGLVTQMIENGVPLTFSSSSTPPSETDLDLFAKLKEGHFPRRQDFEEPEGFELLIEMMGLTEEEANAIEGCSFAAFNEFEQLTPIQQKVVAEKLSGITVEEFRLYLKDDTDKAEEERIRVKMESHSSTIFAKLSQLVATVAEEEEEEVEAP